MGGKWRRKKWRGERIESPFFSSPFPPIFFDNFNNPPKNKATALQAEQLSLTCYSTQP